VYDRFVRVEKEDLSSPLKTESCTGLKAVGRQEKHPPCSPDVPRSVLRRRHDTFSRTAQGASNSVQKELRKSLHPGGYVPQD
jgi:hypothetical protein